MWPAKHPVWGLIDRWSMIAGATLGAVLCLYFNYRSWDYRDPITAMLICLATGGSPVVVRTIIRIASASLGVAEVPVDAEIKSLGADIRLVQDKLDPAGREALQKLLTELQNPING